MTQTIRTEVPILHIIAQHYCSTVADKDGSGSLSAAEVRDVLRHAGFRGTDEDVQVGAVVL